jgi:hypothetical protein
MRGTDGNVQIVRHERRPRSTARLPRHFPDIASGVGGSSGLMCLLHLMASPEAASKVLLAMLVMCGNISPTEKHPSAIIISRYTQFSMICFRIAHGGHGSAMSLERQENEAGRESRPSKGRNHALCDRSVRLHTACP